MGGKGRWRRAYGRRSDGVRWFVRYGRGLLRENGESGGEERLDSVEAVASVGETRWKQRG